MNVTNGVSQPMVYSPINTRSYENNRSSNSFEDSEIIKFEIGYHLLALLVAVCLTTIYFVIFQRVDRYLSERGKTLGFASNVSTPLQQLTEQI